ncbi:MAG TPA: sigma-54 dependent transcriptional regulator [Gemmatimonadaceae bacterium]|nr:sigma-54 dependent transcriptional regulator [Gemmatimonadaceae bacterium]
MKVLITLTDVEPAVRLKNLFERAGVETEVVSPYDDLRTAVEKQKPDVIVLTGGLVDQPNVQLVKRQLWEGTAVVGLSDLDDPTLRDRLRALGYVEIWTKPVDVNEVFDGIKRILERRRLAEITGLSGESDAIREVLVKIEQMAPVSSTVLIEGESGTGKELVARAIHQLSPRRAKPFIPVNIGALPETLLESELFGHEKGAFTGAAERRLGRFELAHTGTLFLDEVGEAPAPTQVKLLRALEEREIMRLGGVSPIRVDVRVVAATNRPLHDHVEEGSFRADLYYRLNVLHIYLPPLRGRPEDIPLLVRKFVREFSEAHGREFKGISAEAMQLLAGYSWPGNVRELRNLVESMVVLSPGREIGAEDIPRELRNGGAPRLLPVHVGPVLRASEGVTGRELEFIVRSMVELKLQVEELRRRLDEVRQPDGQWIGEIQGSSQIAVRSPQSAVASIEPPETSTSEVITIAPGMTMEEIEKAAIRQALAASRGNRRKAAEMLAIGERTLYRKLREYNVPEGM